ncbi:MAG: hypothetical protein AMXMBFR82_18480 [Candidatus Hydrogenedentota bacterium]
MLLLNNPSDTKQTRLPLIDPSNANQFVNAAASSAEVKPNRKRQDTFRLDDFPSNVLRCRAAATRSYFCYLDA